MQISFLEQFFNHVKKVTTLDALADWPTFYTGKHWYIAGDYDPCALLLPHPRA